MAIADINSLYSELMDELDTTNDKEEWFDRYRAVTATMRGYDLDAPETLQDYFSREERTRLYRVVQAEIGDEYSFDQKCHVASVIFNRWEYYGECSLNDVLVANQFSSIRDERYKRVEVSDTTIKACEFAFEIEDTTYGAFFFDSDGSQNYRLIMNDGAHNFYALPRSKEKKKDNEK